MAPTSLERPFLIENLVGWEKICILKAQRCSMERREGGYNQEEICLKCDKPAELQGPRPRLYSSFSLVTCILQKKTLRYKKRSHFWRKIQGILERPRIFPSLGNEWRTPFSEASAPTLPLSAPALPWISFCLPCYLFPSLFPSFRFHVSLLNVHLRLSPWYLLSSPPPAAPPVQLPTSEQPIE